MIVDKPWGKVATYALNPGKAVPTLHRCAEYGAMRVKAGALPHPELPRF